MATGSYMTPIYSRSQSEVQGDHHKLNDSQKLYYLRASLKGEAKLLESPSDSFDSLFSALEDRYENKRQLMDSHVLEIINYEKIYSESQPKNCAL
ncbi:uncharacterized protein TNCV_3704891 [Trichonephila clavipes]|nr:uncharacterized protein TNCV_3704891 [Trichonephila clavipes]